MKVYCLWGLFVPWLYIKPDRKCVILALPFVSIFFDYYPVWKTNVCKSCCIYYADGLSDLCPGCQAYKDHQQ